MNKASLLRWTLGACAALGVSGCSYLQRSTLLIPSIPLNKQTQLANPMSVNVSDSEHAGVHDLGAGVRGQLKVKEAGVGAG